MRSLKLLGVGRAHARPYIGVRELDDRSGRGHAAMLQRRPTAMPDTGHPTENWVG